VRFPEKSLAFDTSEGAEGCWKGRFPETETVALIQSCMVARRRTEVHGLVVVVVAVAAAIAAAVAPVADLDTILHPLCAWCAPSYGWYCCGGRIRARWSAGSDEKKY
jgi:hypothetical protein